MDWNIKFTDLCIIAATILGPVLAVQAQKFLERRRQTTDRRVQIFQTLMTTRAQALNPSHVLALNAVPIEFHGKDERLQKVVDAWRNYMDLLGNRQIDRSVWDSKRTDLLVELLLEMARCLGYKFSKSQIAKEIYAPEGHGRIEFEQDSIRQGMVEVLAGKKAFPIVVTNMPSPPAPAPAPRQSFGTFFEMEEEEEEEGLGTGMGEEVSSPSPPKA